MTRIHGLLAASLTLAGLVACDAPAPDRSPAAPDDALTIGGFGDGDPTPAGACTWTATQARTEGFAAFVLERWSDFGAEPELSAHAGAEAFLHHLWMSGPVEAERATLALNLAANRRGVFGGVDDLGRLQVPEGLYAGASPADLLAAQANDADQANALLAALRGFNAAYPGCAPVTGPVHLLSDSTDNDGDGVPDFQDCDDGDASLGEVLYTDDLSADDGWFAPTEQLDDPWAWNGAATFAQSGGQQAQLGHAETWGDVAVFATVASRGTEASCGDCDGTLFRLHDHPDGAAAEPYYGLRLDGLFSGLTGATGGVTTFSFDTQDASVYSSIDETTGAVRVWGTVYGGEDSGTSYGFGEGHYQLYLVYNANVSAVSDGWEADIGSGELENQGWILSLDNADTAGQSWDLYDYASSGPTFLLKQDGHRHPDASAWVGRGWLNQDAARPGRGNTRDLLFVADPVKCDDRRYSVFAYDGGHALWLPDFNESGATVILEFEDGDAVFAVDTDGSATLEGTATVTSLGGGAGTLGETWDVEMRFTYRGQGPAYGGPKIEMAALQPSWLSDTWEYWDMTAGTLSRDGATVTLTQRPASGIYPFQLGDSANNKDKRLGASMWFDWSRVDDDGGASSGHGDLNVELWPARPVCADRWRAGVLLRSTLDADQDEGYHGYRCALSSNSARDCFDEGTFLQLAEFMDHEEDDVSSECDEGCPENTTFDQLDRTNHGAIDLAGGDTATLRFYAVGSDLYCAAEGADGAVITATATDDSFTEGTVGFSTLNMYGEFDSITVCEATAVP
ncbi:MAG: hypothetical protein H6739_12110 [Alphaproteobacteria bacterium]|nr:hypothetical protein [Alphaproteobacteria bacterium]